MIYTCYEMIQDCRAGKPEGWSYFMAQYAPIARRIAAHYGSNDVEPVLPQLRGTLFEGMHPMPERHFVAELRQALLAALFPEQPLALDLQTLAQALAPLTVVEKKAVWLETMRYGNQDAGRILRLDPDTVGKIRDRGAELIRAGQDRWSRSLLEDHGRQLGRAAARQAAEPCISVKALLDMIDGRSTWYQREEMERHIAGCLHCIDHFCRMHEVCDLLRSAARAGQ